MKNIYTKEPISIKNNIPIFSEIDDYIINYEKISIDHFASIKNGITNPFIEEEIWLAMEKSTSDLIEIYGKNQKNLKILDVGVGLGRLLSGFSQFDCYGIDIVMPNLEHTKDKSIEVALSKVEDMPYVDNFFDMIVCTDVLEHVIDLNIAIKQIKRVLRPGGTLIVRVPYRENLIPYLSEEYPYHYAHLRAFDEAGLKLYFNKIFNMKYIHTSYTAYIMNYDKVICQKINYIKKIIWIFLRLLRKINSPHFDKMKQKLLEPTEINVVFKK